MPGAEAMHRGEGGGSRLTVLILAPPLRVTPLSNFSQFAFFFYFRFLTISNGWNTQSEFKFGKMRPELCPNLFFGLKSRLRYKEVVSPP